ncbi:MAG: peptidyl-dipeptidase [Actinomycetota bacterium]|nr:peptidyl-dipeptidase [Actinomycetota bacterium]
MVEDLQERIQAIEVEFHRAYWDSQIEASAEHDRARAQLELELRKLKGDPEALAAVQQALATELHEPVLRRELEVLRLSLTGNQMDEGQRAALVELSTQVESEFAAYRPEIEGRRYTDNELIEILKESDDVPLRKRAWEASKEVGTVVAGRVLEIVRLRNEAARDLGFDDYYRMSLSLQEFDEAWLFGILDELEHLTDGPFRRWKSALDDNLRRRFGTEDIHPWHYADPFFQALPADGSVSLDSHLAELSASDLALRTFAAWGIDVSRMLEVSDIYPKENKCQHAFCLDIDRSGKDVRVLANVVPGEHWVEVMLHESGHAAYDMSVSPDLPYLLRRAAHTFVTEAIAISSGRLARDPEWLTTIAQLDGDAVASIADELVRATAAHSLLFARWGLVMTHFERALYSDPEGDLDALWWELVERFQLVDVPADVKDEKRPGRWASKIHLAVAPVYYHNYLLGEMLASQLRNTIEQQCGGFVANADAGRWLVEKIFARGSEASWDHIVEDATGRPLSAADLAEQLQLV